MRLRPLVVRRTTHPSTDLAQFPRQRTLRRGYFNSSTHRGLSKDLQVPPQQPRILPPRPFLLLRDTWITAHSLIFTFPQLPPASPPRQLRQQQEASPPNAALRS